MAMLFVATVRVVKCYSVFRAARRYDADRFWNIFKRWFRRYRKWKPEFVGAVVGSAKAFKSVSFGLSHS